MALPVDKLMLTEYAAEVMVYFEKHKLLEVIARIVAEIDIERPKDAQLWIAKNILRIADNIYRNCLDVSFHGSTNVERFYQLPRKFHHRVVIYGRHGSGRKSQALALVKRFNLVHIDADQLIYKNLRESDELATELQAAFTNDDANAKSKALSKIVARRFLQMDALRKGWVLINYPNNVREFMELFESFKIPPNKLIYLKCPEKMAMRRLIAQPNLGHPQDNCKYLEREMAYFNDNEDEIYEYLKSRHEAIFVDATPCYQDVKQVLWAKLEVTPYVLGKKN